MFSAQYTFAFVLRHSNFIKQMSFEITLEQVFENFIEHPPAPQNPSNIVSHFILLAMCYATAYGVTLYQDSSSNEIPSSNLSNSMYLRSQFLSKFELARESDLSWRFDLFVSFFAFADASTRTVLILASILPLEVPIVTISFYLYS